ncbi:CPBP family glutamic-type intramembrane protease [Dethiothermospora halolimnae]|uniref:CPBP family glutamic-type intramembrane protease n=1 Tax=Dethiothermospora halolimnae TaxID=3114390 RepID=UPI003CCC0A72
MKLFNPIVAILLTSLIFLAIHIKTWDEKFVWIGSLILSLVCAMSVYFTKSIWTAIIIHNLNDFGFLTLVNSRNIFKDKTVETADR